jgi:acyl carrier protein
MSITATAREIVYAAIAAVNEELPQGSRIEADDPTPLAGPDSGLDSLRLINLVVHVEDGIERDHGLQVSLTDSPDLFDSGGPLATTGGFIDHVAVLIRGGAA